MSISEGLNKVESAKHIIEAEERAADPIRRNFLMKEIQIKIRKLIGKQEHQPQRVFSIRKHCWEKKGVNYIEG